MPNGKPPFPASFGVLNAPPSWRCIDFISDIHLDPALPNTTARLQQYLSGTSADAVLILGDLFEAWLGDDSRQEPYEAQCTEMLRQAGQRLHLGLMVGNRDFLIGSDLIAACHGHPLQDPTVLHAWGQTILLMHGDELCLADTEYLKFRQMVRQPIWQSQFLSQPLVNRQAAARQMREASQAHQKQMTPQEWADVDEPTASDWMRAAGASHLIHGHTHRPRSEPFGPGTRHVLSDWDLDHTKPQRAQVLRLTEGGFTRIDLV
ncbi:MAG TPA: UDP-2,3-diacylglucosamine diphosphatase [Aquabacterium sp.]|nr:UDP-2,3-diacylglucosamine diphosphatase [Aquabacterium sp.]